MVDLLGRAGKVHEAYEFIQEMGCAPDRIMLGSLLSACKAHKAFELGEKVAKALLDDEGVQRSCDPGTYILVSNFYSSWGKWDEALLVREELKKKKVCTQDKHIGAFTCYHIQMQPNLRKCSKVNLLKARAKSSMES